MAAQEADTMAVDTADVIAEVKKNSREVVRLRRTHFKGVDLLDARVWTVPAVPGGESAPTKKGLTLRPATWAALVVALKIALDGGCELDAEEDPLAGDV